MPVDGDFAPVEPDAVPVADRFPDRLDAQGGVLRRLAGQGRAEAGFQRLPGGDARPFLFQQDDAETLGELGGIRPRLRRACPGQRRVKLTITREYVRQFVRLLFGVVDQRLPAVEIGVGVLARVSEVRRLALHR